MVFSGRIPGTRLRYWPAGLQLMAWEDTAGRNAAYGVRRSGGPERSLRREKKRRAGTQLMAQEGAADRNAAYGVRRSSGPERSLRREKKRQAGTQLNDWDFLMGRAVLWFGG